MLMRSKDIMKEKNMLLKDRLKNGEFVVGTWCVLPSVSTINVLAKAGLDFVIIDMEHGPVDFHLASQMIMAAEVDGCEAIVRVSNNNESDILKALDIGASGVIVPHIETVQDREKAIAYMKYPPKGVRGFSPYTRAGGYISKVDHTMRENEATLSGIIVEGLEGIENIDEIIDDQDLDIVYIGTYDLSVVLGVPGDVKNQKVMKTLEKCVEKVINKGKAAGSLFHTLDELEYFRDLGMQLLCYKVDTSVLFDKYNAICKTFYRSTGIGK